MVNRKKITQKLPNSPGIYQFLDEKNTIIYIGKSVSIKKRVSSYFANKDLGPKTNLLVSKIAKVNCIKVFSEFEALLLESELIRTHQPFFNIIAKDDKSPLYIKITNDPIPLITLTRKETGTKGIFLKGPFPSSRVTRSILKNIRKIFPYCQHKRPKKPCLYVHLGLCPYPYASQQSIENYKEGIIKIKKLLSGKTKSLIFDLKQEMKDYSQNEEYEKAQITKKQIENLEYLENTYRTPREFLEQPTLVDDLNLLKLKDFQKVIKLKKIPKRIECYDISNISGKNAAGSMVVFTNGIADKSQYRKFKIRLSDTPNDYLMLQEVLSRRIKNGWLKADVIIIDGGRDQLNAALKIIKNSNYPTTVISLAKRFEEVYTEDEDLPIRLPKESPARQLAQAIRDEAHRFAVTYHRKLRSQKFISPK